MTNKTDIINKKNFLKLLIKEKTDNKIIRRNGRTYLTKECDWCSCYHMKRKDSVSKTNNSFCDRWCESRYKSTEIIVPRKDKSKNPE